MPIHPTAVVSPEAKIHPTAEIGPYAIIAGEVTIGPGCRVFPHACIYGYTQIGEGNEIHSGAVLGGTPQDRRFQPCRSYVRIGKGNIIREHVTIHRGTEAESVTALGDDCYLMAGSHIGHNCRVGNAVTMPNGVALSGHVEVGDGVVFSGGAMVHQFVRIGRLCMIGRAARVKMDVPAFLMMGDDSQVVGINRIGLRRAGFSEEHIAQIRSAYRTLYRKGMLFRKAVARIKADHPHPPVTEMIAFIEGPSKRGIAGPRDRRHRRAGPTSAPEAP